MIDSWELVVVGAGPAGALAAREAARRGRRVLLVEKSRFPRDKVCGCCINRSALATLADAGVELPPGAEPLSRMHLAAGGRSAELPLPGGVALSRAALDSALVAAARAAGASFLEETTARDGGERADGHRLVLRGPRGEREVSAEVVLLATGLGGSSSGGADVRVARGARIGAGLRAASAHDDYAAGTIYMGCGREGYVGAVRLADGSLNVACALDPAAVRRAGGIEALADEIVDGAGLPPLPAGRWRGTPTLSRRARRIGAGRVLRLGDAASFVEPFTGQGISWALASGAAIAPLVARGWRPSLAGEWARTFRRTVARRQLECSILRFLLRSPRFVRLATGLLARSPLLAAPLVRSINRPGSFESRSLPT